MNNYTIEPTGPNVLTIRFTDISVGWEQWILFRADAHHDSPYCDRELECKHLNKAREREALIADFGDLFDAMQGKFDPRRNMDDVRSEDAKVNYYDLIVDHASDIYRKFADLWALFIPGNHEMAVLKNTNHCLITALVQKMRAAGSQCQIGGYGGWIRLMFTVNGSKRSSKNIKYFHGAGGGGPVTRGTIQTNRQSVYLPDADVVVNGHTHDSWVLPIARERLNTAGRVKRDLIWHVRVPGYKNDYADGSRGFAVEKWMPPKPLGCCWLRLYLEDANSGRIGMEAIQDVV